ncbi:hypothetical protein ACI797_16475 [Geodermatophilus sp. SYSU D00691]
MKPEALWYWSTILHRHGFTPLAKLLKAVNFVLYKAVLPYECVVPRDIVLWHKGLGTVIHPNTVIGRGVRISHNVTVAAGTWRIGDGVNVTIEDGVVLGVGSVVIAREGQPLRLGRGTVVGANATVTRDVPPRSRVLAGRSTIVGGGSSESD